MRNYISFIIWGLIAFFAATFLFIFVFFAITNDNGQVEEPPTEEQKEEQNGESSNEDSNQEEREDSANKDSSKDKMI